MKALPHFTLLLISSLLAGCGATGAKFSEIKSPPSSTGAIYVYRLSNFVAGASAPILVIDGKEVANLRNGGYIRRELAPGHHVVELKNGGIDSSKRPVAVDVVVQSGTAQFFRYTIEMLDGGMYEKNRFARSLDMVEREIAQIELKQTSESE